MFAGKNAFIMLNLSFVVPGSIPRRVSRTLYTRNWKKEKVAFCGIFLKPTDLSTI